MQLCFCLVYGGHTHTYTHSLWSYKQCHVTTPETIALQEKVNDFKLEPPITSTALSNFKKKPFYSCWVRLQARDASVVRKVVAAFFIPSLMVLWFRLRAISIVLSEETSVPLPF